MLSVAGKGDTMSALYLTAKSDAIRTLRTAVSRLTDITRIARRDAREGHYRPPVYLSAFELDRYKLAYLHALWRRRIHVS